MSILNTILPPKKWQFAVAIASGLLFGLLAYIFYISNAVSYMSDDPRACINCHVMNPQYASWTHSAHREYATCNDCHVPQNNILNKYFFKAKDGLRHATMFTLRLEPQ
jgi:cytochrome c nitrite reductase small subunit